MTQAAAGPLPGRLGDFVWDSLKAARARAGQHPDGIVDLSIGTPVDPVPTTVRSALSAASDWPGYPTVHGTAELRQAYSQWLLRSHGVDDVDPENVVPTPGSKELVASLPGQLGLGPDDMVGIPPLAYPTYEVGARQCGADFVRVADGAALPDRVRMIWLNSPSNPTGRVSSPEKLRKIVRWARANDVLLASDECYLDLGWDAHPVSILHPDVCEGDYTGLLAVHSLSKRSNMAGYRIGFVTGDPTLVQQLLADRKQLGAIVPGPIQAAATAALNDDSHVLVQRTRYGARRDALAEAFAGAGFRSSDDDGTAGLYLWLTRGEPAMDTVEALAEQGILVAPGTFYGPAGARHIRVAVTATDERVKAAVRRLAG